MSSVGQETAIFVLLGPPGSGKGTQAAILSERTGLPHLSTGDLCREAVRAGTPAGLRAESHLQSGELVPDDLVIKLVEEFVSADRERGICFDGFPRTRLQAEALDRSLERLGRRVTEVLLINLSDEASLERLIGRGRPDDAPETAQYRIKVYHEETEPLIAYYSKQGKLVEIDGSLDVRGVADAVWKAVEAVR